jgi:hypothetical protein
MGRRTDTALQRDRNAGRRETSSFSNGKTATALLPAVKPRHLGFGPGLVDEDPPQGVDARLKPAPAVAMAASFNPGYEFVT